MDATFGGRGGAGEGSSGSQLLSGDLALHTCELVTSQSTSGQLPLCSATECPRVTV